MKANFSVSRSAFSSNYSRSSIPSSTTLTYEGIFSENYFYLNEKENKLNMNYEKVMKEHEGN